MTDAASISYDELNEIDLDALEAIPDAELLAYFEQLARRATDGQLMQALGMRPWNTASDFEDLVKAYASRRHATAVKLRALKDW